MRFPAVNPARCTNEMALPPCHALFPSFYVAAWSQLGAASCISAPGDIFPRVPFQYRPSYALADV